MPTYGDNFQTEEADESDIFIVALCDLVNASLDSAILQ
jgi:hypothetical protein